VADAKREALRATVSRELEVFDRVYDAIEGLLTSRVIHVKFPAGVNATMLDLQIGLLTKSCKTMRRRSPRGPARTPRGIDRARARRDDRGTAAGNRHA
jgi:hypothetical protein